MWEDEAVRLTAELVRIPSVTGEEGELAGFLADALSSAGLRVEIQEVEPGRPNVVAVLPGEEDRIGLVFLAHTDTVPPMGMEDPFSGRDDGERIWGRGSCDQKAGLAASMAVLMEMASREGLERGLALAAVVDEEREHRGIFRLVESGLSADWGLCTEPTGLRVAVGCKGTLPLRITVRGRAAHGSAPWAGINAISKMARVISALEGEELPSVDIPGVGEVRASLCVGLISGGRAYNVVPDECSIWVDRRMIPGETPERVISSVRALLERLRSEDPDLRAEVCVDRPDWSWEPVRRRGLMPCVVDPSEPIVEAVSRAHESAAGSRSRLWFSSGYFEMDFLVNDLSIPTVAYGPGDPELAHTEREHVGKDDVRTAYRVYRRVALWASRPA